MSVETFRSGPFLLNIFTSGANQIQGTTASLPVIPFTSPWGDDSKPQLTYNNDALWAEYMPQRFKTPSPTNYTFWEVGEIFRRENVGMTLGLRVCGASAAKAAANFDDRNNVASLTLTGKHKGVFGNQINWKIQAPSTPMGYFSKVFISPDNTSTFWDYTHVFNADVDAAGKKIWRDNSTNHTVPVEVTSGNVIPFDLAETGNRLYIGWSALRKFNSVSIIVGNSPVAGVGTWKYYNGSSFVTLEGATNFQDGTSDLSTTGVVSFNAPDDWVVSPASQPTAGLYFICFETTTAFTTLPTLTYSGIIMYPTTNGRNARSATGGTYLASSQIVTSFTGTTSSNGTTKVEWYDGSTWKSLIAAATDDDTYLAGWWVPVGVKKSTFQGLEAYWYRIIMTDSGSNDSMSVLTPRENKFNVAITPPGGTATTYKNVSLHPNHPNFIEGMMKNDQWAVADELPDSVTRPGDHYLISGDPNTGDGYYNLGFLTGGLDDLAGVTESVMIGSTNGVTGDSTGIVACGKTNAFQICCPGAAFRTDGINEALVTATGTNFFLQARLQAEYYTRLRDMIDVEAIKYSTPNAKHSWGAVSIIVPELGNQKLTISECLLSVAMTCNVFALPTGPAQPASNFQLKGQYYWNRPQLPDPNEQQEAEDAGIWCAVPTLFTGLAGDTSGTVFEGQGAITLDSTKDWAVEAHRMVLHAVVFDLIKDNQQGLRTYKDKLNDPALWNQVRTKINQYLATKFSARWFVRDFNGKQATYCVCDATNNTAQTLDRNELHVRLRLQFQSIAHELDVDIFKGTFQELDQAA